MSAAIEIENLSMSYGSHTVLNGLNLQVHQGEFFGFLGQNGAGKSTTMRILTGLMRPTSGKARVAGIDVVKNPDAVKSQIGIVMEDIALYERLSSAEYLEFSGQMHGLSASEARRRTRILLEQLELTAAADRLIGEYSQGMRKKTALAAALIHAPRILFLDEPFNAVDALSVRTLCNLLKHLTQEKGVTIFFTSHVFEVVERLCERIAVLHEGSIVAEGTVEQVVVNSAPKVGPRATFEETVLFLTGNPPVSLSIPDWF
jgi:ABC-2 type transport system ATP-binding protein